MTGRWAGTFVALAVALVASAHVGSPDTLFEGAAGPYRVRVIVRPPGIVPGQADITVRMLSGIGARAVLVLPLRGGRPTAEEPPPDSAKVVAGSSDLYSAQLWLMEEGAYSIQVTVSGTAGSGTVLVPVNSVATRRLGFDTPLAVGLLALGAFLFVGAITIVGAAVRESVLAPGDEPDAGRRRRSWWIRILAVPLLTFAVFAGKKWWDVNDAAHMASLYRPMSVKTTIAGGPPVLTLAIVDSDWLGRQFSPLIPDHGKLMHLFLVRDDLTGFAHLHPLMVDSSTFRASLPPLPPGHYRLYADVVHESGFTQTLLDSVSLAGSGAAWNPTDPDDSWSLNRQLSAVSDQPSAVSLADGSTMTWVHDSAPLVAGRDVELRFIVRGRDGQPVALEPYMGMLSHAVIARGDGSVFVHLHPAGTISMASQLAYALRQPGDTIRGVLGTRITSTEQSPSQSSAMLMNGDPGVVTLPYAFPQPGQYRLWVQVKMKGRILTGAFDARVS